MRLIFIKQCLQLIYAGKVLKDNALPLSAFISGDVSPVAIHIVIKAPAPSAAPARAASAHPAPVALATNVSARPQPTQSGLQPSQNAAPSAANVGHREQPQPTVSSGDRPRSPLPGTHFGSEPLAQPQFQPQFTGSAVPLFGMLPSATTAAAAAAAGVYGTQAAIYGPAYHAAYQAALQALMSQQSQQSQPGASSGNQPAVTLLPAMMPQPVLPPGFFAPQHQQQQHQNQHQQPQQQGPDGAEAAPMFPGQMVYPVFQLPMPMAYPMALPIPQMQQVHQQIPVPQMPQGMEVRRRRRGPNNPLPDEVMRLARNLRARGIPMPPEINAALEREDAAAGLRPGAGQQGAARPRGRGFQLRVRINVRALLQLAVLLVVVYQHCPPKRFVMLCVLGFVLWLSTTTRVRAFLQAVTGIGGARPQNEGLQAEQPGAPAAAQNAAPAPGADVAVPNNAQQGAEAVGGGVPVVEGPNFPPQPPVDPQAAPPAQQRGGLLREIHTFVVGFITSLLPAMDQQNNPAGGEGGPMQDVFAGGD